MPRRRSGKKIDFVHWTGFSDTFNGQAAGSVGKTLFAAQHDPETLLRIRGNFVSYVDGAQAPGGQIGVGAGIILVPEGTGTTVLWAPLADADAPWIWYTSFLLGYEEYVTDVIDSPGVTSFREVIDNKAMRVIRNQEVQLVVEQGTTGTAMSMNGAIHGRGLFGT